MKIKYAIFLALSTSLWANTPQSKILELYPNASFLNYNFTVKSGKFQTKLPGFVDLKNLSTRTSCDIVKSELGEIKDLQAKVEEELKALKKEKENLAIKLKVATAKENLLKSFSLEKSSLKGIKQKSATFGKMLQDNLHLQAKINEDIEKIDKEIEKLKDKRGIGKDKNLIMQLKCDKPSILKISFPLENIKYKTIQNFNANSIQNKLDITQVAYINHSLDDILQNVRIRFYSFLYNQNIKPIFFEPSYVNVQRPTKRRAYSDDGMVVGAPVPMMMKKTSNSVTAYATAKNSSTKRMWETKPINLIAGEENEVIFDEQNLKIEFDNLIDGYGSVKAYLKGSFSPKEFIEAGDANLILDGVQMGKTYVKELPKGKKAHLYFGQNDLIKIKKVLSKIYTDDSLFGTAQSTQKIWNYTITNLGEKPQNITLLERMPISAHEKVTIKSLSNPKPDEVSKRGKASWKFLLKKGEEKVLTFGYEVEKPTVK